MDLLRSKRMWLPAPRRGGGLVIGAVLLTLIITGCNVVAVEESDAAAEHEHGAAAQAVAHLHDVGEIEMPHIHGMDFAGDGASLTVAAHDGLRLFADGEWLIPDVPVNDYMGFSPVDEGFYSSGHPGPDSALPNPLGLIKSTDGGATINTLKFSGESDFHLMDVGYYSHATYVINGRPNSELSTGLFYSLDEGESWQQSAAQGVTAQPIAMAVHPTQPEVVAIATEGGLFFSTDHGNTFTLLAQSAPATAASFSPAGDRLFFGYQTITAYELESGELSPVAAPSIAADDAIAYLAVSSQAVEMAVATFNRNIYFSEDDGNGWTTIVEDGKAVDTK